MHEPINSFLHHLVVERGFSHNTLEAYRNDLYQLMTYVKGKLPSANGASTWGHIGAELLTEYVFSHFIDKFLDSFFWITESIIHWTTSTETTKWENK